MNKNKLNSKELFRKFELKILNFSFHSQNFYYARLSISKFFQFEILYFNEVFIYFQETALNIAVRNNNAEIVKLLLQNPKIDVNFMNILYNFILNFISN